MNKKSPMIQTIDSNIKKYGHHVYVVAGSSPTPRFVYTIGLTGRLGCELIFCGGAIYTADEVVNIINGVAAVLVSSQNVDNLVVNMPEYGSFDIRPAHESWVQKLLLGARDYYQRDDIQGFQIVPDVAHYTRDIPDITLKWDPSAEPVWRWLEEPWEYSVPPGSVAVTDLEALRGKRVTEAMRWEDDNWELFTGAGPDFLPEDLRSVPLGTLLAIDTSLAAVTRLSVGKGIWRAPPDWVWQSWN